MADTALTFHLDQGGSWFDSAMPESHFRVTIDLVGSQAISLSRSGSFQMFGEGRELVKIDATCKTWSNIGATLGVTEAVAEAVVVAFTEETELLLCV